jgi:membrane carboxypeptidase/penicillin-binding protein
MQEGMTPCDKVVNLPQTFVLPDGNTWTPRSTDKEEWIGKTVTLKWGLTNSSNNISAYLMKQFGPEAMADMMRRMDKEKFFSNDSWSERSKKKKWKRFYQVRNSTYLSHHYGRNWAVRYLHKR